MACLVPRISCTGGSGDINISHSNIIVTNLMILNHAAAMSGVTYTRWGQSSCPSDTGSQLVYSGRAGGTNHRARGGAAKKICLPDDPDYISGAPVAASNPRSVVQGAEYEIFSSSPISNLHEHNTPCAVCYVPTRATTIMVPAKTTCPSSWIREYYGYLTTEYDGHYRSSYTCLDINPEVVAGTSADTDPSLFYHTVTDCNGLSCPPYENNRILSCVVCTK